MTLRIQGTSCCSALLSKNLEEVFSLTFPFYYNHLEYAILSNDALLQISLYGDKNFQDDLNKNVLLLTLRFIHRTGQFD